jgi:biopolymer transport protein ExbD
MSNTNNPYLEAAAQAGEKVTAAQRSKIRRLSAPKEVDESEEAGELNIVPFLDIITNVMMFVLASISVTFTVTLDANAPRSSKGGVQQKPLNDDSLNLTIIVGIDGYYVKAKGGSLGTGCKEGSSTVTVPRIDAAGEGNEGNKKYDAAGLRKCLRYVKDKYEVAHHDRQVLLTAGPNIPFQEIVRVMDAIRGDEAGSCKEMCPSEVDPATGDQVHMVCNQGQCAKECGDDTTKCSELFPDVIFTVLGGSK